MASSWNFLSASHIHGVASAAAPRQQQGSPSYDLQLPMHGSRPAAGHVVDLQRPAALEGACTQGPPPESVEVVCGTARGILLVRKGRIVYEGSEVSPTEFEKLGGRGSSKKWKTSVRIALPGGVTGQSVGDWLSACGIEIARSQVAPSGERMTKVASMPRVAPGQTHAQHATATPDHYMHPEQQFFCRLAGDPTLDTLPGDMPASSLPRSPSQQSDVSHVEVGGVTYKGLMDLALASRSSGALADLLQSEAGILDHREAYLTGHQPKRARVGPVVAEVALRELSEFMAGLRAEPPWEALGLARAPVINGRDLDLRRLYYLTHELGGYEVVTNNKLWHKVAHRMGINIDAITNAGWLLRTHYARFLLAYEAERIRSGTAAPAAAPSMAHARQPSQELLSAAPQQQHAFYATHSASAPQPPAPFVHPGEGHFLPSSGEQQPGYGHGGYSQQAGGCGEGFAVEDAPTWQHLAEALRQGEADAAEEALGFLHDPDSDTPGAIPSPIAQNFDDGPTSLPQPPGAGAPEPSGAALQGPDLFQAEAAIAPVLHATHLAPGGPPQAEHSQAAAAFPGHAPAALQGECVRLETGAVRQ